MTSVSPRHTEHKVWGHPGPPGDRPQSSIRPPSPSAHGPGPTPTPKLPSARCCSFSVDPESEARPGLSPSGLGEGGCSPHRCSPGGHGKQSDPTPQRGAHGWSPLCTRRGQSARDAAWPRTATRDPRTGSPGCRTFRSPFRFRSAREP